MGLLSFLSSRKSYERPSRPSSSLQGQAYHATAPSLPPVQGTYPMNGNGLAASYEALHRPRHQRKQSIPLPPDSDSDGGAPAPFVPRFRDANIERPRTAPNGAGSPFKNPQRRRDSLIKAPPLSFRKPKSDSVSSATKPATSSIRPSGASHQARVQTPSTPFAHVRTNSLHSMNTGRGFVDLLDAQSQFVPLQFQTRVKAEGARDYGEDVADRNLGENGTDLTSPQAQAFYALTGRNPCDEPDSRPPPIWTSTFGDNGQPFQPPARNESLDHARRMSRHSFVNPLSQNPPFPTLPEELISNEPRSRISLHMSQPNRTDRRQSLSSYIPSVPASPYVEATARPKSMHEPNRSAHQLASTDQPASFRSSTSSGLGIYPHPVPQMQPEPPAPSAPFARDSLMLAKKNYSLPSNSKTSERPYRERPIGVRYSSRDEVVRNEVLRDDVPAGQQGARRRPSDSSQIVSPLQMNSSRNHLIDVGYDSADEGDGWTEQFSFHTADALPASVSQATQSSRSRKKSVEGPYHRAKSQGPLHGRIRLDEIYEHIPIRTSSLNQWSVSSNTPTMSSTSSTRYARPNSRHTPSTSIDLPVVSPKHVCRSCTSHGSGPDDASSYHTALNSTAHTPVTSPVRVHADFNIDDYLSSDDDIDADSIISPREEPGEREHGLLFRNTGYGGDGLQLPGLLDSIPAVPAPPVAHPLRHSRSTPLAGLYESDGGRRLTLGPKTHAQGYASDEGDRDEVQEEIGGFPREDLAPGRRGMKRISALGAAHQGQSEQLALSSPIEEEKEGKVDVRAAVRLRKEAKARARAGGRVRVRGRSRRRSSARAEDGHCADVET